MTSSTIRVLLTGVILLAASTAQAQLTNSDIDAIAKALKNEPTFNEGGHEGKIGYWFIRIFRTDWPVKDKDIRDTWDLDPKQDTDADGVPDADDDDIDGDGIPNFRDDDIDGDDKLNHEDGNPYDSTQFKYDPRNEKDSDGDGIPDVFDSYPVDPSRVFVSKRLEKMKGKLVEAAFAKQARGRD